MDTSQECSGPEAFQLAQCSDQSTLVLHLHLRDLTPCCITCEFLVVALSLQGFPFLLVSEALLHCQVCFVYCLVRLL